jgi:sulfopyruvate decarboxylase TPP-binding subunit
VTSTRSPGRHPAAAIDSPIVVDALAAIGTTHVVIVPDTHQRTVLELIDTRTDLPVVRAATEDDVLGICAGLWMAGRKPVALIQQLGLFASANALRAFSHDHRVPLAIVAGLYGRQLGREVFSDDQPSAVRLCVPLLEALELTWTLVERPEDSHLIAPTLAAAFEDQETRVVLIGAPTT